LPLSFWFDGAFWICPLKTEYYWNCIFYPTVKSVAIYFKDLADLPEIDCSRFKKGRSWTKKGAFFLLKIKETILNGKWNFW
jgi:hypothetical protein